MDTGKFVGLLVFGVIGVLLVVAFTPMIAETTSDSDTFTNAGRYYVNTEIDGETTITMNYDIDGTTRQWYIDDVLLEYEPTTIGPDYAQTTTVVGADNLLFRTDGRARGLTSSTGGADFSLTVTNEGITYGAVVSHAPLFVASTKTTDYVLYNNISTPCLVKGDSVLIACGYTVVGVSEAVDDTPAVNTNLVISFSGTVKDGFEITTYDNNYTFTVDNVIVNATAHAGYVDLYDFTSVEFDIISENDVSTHCTYSVLVVPAEITAEKSIHPSPALATIINMLPLIIVVGLLMILVAEFLIGRYL